MTIGDMRQGNDAPRQTGLHAGGSEPAASEDARRDWISTFVPRTAEGELLPASIRLEQMRMFVESQKLPLP